MHVKYCPRFELTLLLYMPSSQETQAEQPTLEKPVASLAQQLSQPYLLISLRKTSHTSDTNDTKSANNCSGMERSAQQTMTVEVCIAQLEAVLAEL
jgi:hypothetical protein